MSILKIVSILSTDAGDHLKRVMSVAGDLFQRLAEVRDIRLVFIQQLEALLRITNDRVELLIDFIDNRHDCLTRGCSLRRHRELSLGPRHRLSRGLMFDRKTRDARGGLSQTSLLTGW